ncbi:MAG: hypothetical protein ACYCPT_08340 [Acidimicrobiales bacterium]
MQTAATIQKLGGIDKQKQHKPLRINKSVLIHSNNIIFPLHIRILKISYLLDNKITPANSISYIYKIFPYLKNIKILRPKDIIKFLVSQHSAISFYKQALSFVFSNIPQNNFAIISKAALPKPTIPNPSKTFHIKSITNKTAMPLMRILLAYEISLLQYFYQLNDWYESYIPNIIILYDRGVKEEAGTPKKKVK